MMLLNSTKTKMVLKVCIVVFMLTMVAMPALAQYGLEEIATTADLPGADGDGDLKTTIGQLLSVALGFLGVLAVIIVLIGGFKYMIAGGTEEKVKDARKWIISGIIGLAIILSAYAITSFVLNSLLEANRVE
jgi:hypothetical protein